MKKKIFRNFIACSRKIDEFCDPICESLGIDCRKMNLSKYSPWGIMLLVCVFYASVTYLIWICLMPSQI